MKIIWKYSQDQETKNKQLQHPTLSLLSSIDLPSSKKCKQEFLTINDLYQQENFLSHKRYRRTIYLLILSLLIQSFLIIINKNSLVHSTLNFKLVFLGNFYLNIIIHVIFIVLGIYHINLSKTDQKHPKISRQFKLYIVILLSIKSIGMYLLMRQWQLKSFKRPLLLEFISELCVLILMVLNETYYLRKISGIQI